MNYKFTLALLFSLQLLFSTNAFTQSRSQANVIFGSETPVNTNNIGFFIAPSYGLTRMDAVSASLFHLRGGVTFKDNFNFGVYLNTSLNEIKPISETLNNIYMDYWSLGGFVEYTLRSDKVAHLTFPLFLGYGEVQMDNEKGNIGLGESGFFQIEPSALFELNLHRYARFNIGIGYRFISEMNYRNFNQSDISGLTGYIGLKFGIFR